MQFPSALIRYERLKRNWSQEGLCEGICAVSYLSKIEQGKAEPGEEILSALRKRLDIEWNDGGEAAHWVEETLEALFSMNREKVLYQYEQLQRHRTRYLHGPQMLDVLLLERLNPSLEEAPVQEVSPAAFEDCFTARQRALWLLSGGRFEEALGLLPNAWLFLRCGEEAWRCGQYSHAMERLLRANALAAEEGRARVMMYARTYLGNCCSDQLDEEAMMHHYAAAKRLAEELGETDLLEGIRYNIAATALTRGDLESAHAYFASLENPGRLQLHKLAVCLERMGRRQEALAALDRLEQADRLYPDESTDAPDAGWISRMGSLVRYRLEHPAYLRDPSYGEMLLDAFSGIRRELPHGFVLFHLPWVEEWYTANRQYKQAYELRKEIFSQTG